MQAELEASHQREAQLRQLLEASDEMLAGADASAIGVPASSPARDNQILALTREELLNTRLELKGALESAVAGRENIERLQGELVEVTGERDRCQAAVSSTVAQVAKARDEADRAREDCGKAREDSERVGRQLDVLQQAAGMGMDADAGPREVAAVCAQNSLLESQLKAAQRELRSTLQAAIVDQNELDQLQATASQAQAEIASLRAQLAEGAPPSAAVPALENSGVEQSEPQLALVSRVNDELRAEISRL
jgi:chromosome segregation ATPase